VNVSVTLPDTGVDTEKLGLRFFLEVLQRSAMAMPGLNRSVEIVKRHMQGILERRSRRYLESLFPVSHNPSASAGMMREQDQQRQRQSSFSTPTSHSIPVPSTNPSTSATQYQSFPLEVQTPQPDGNTNTNYNAYPTFNLEGLPAFPGQDFNMGMDCNLDQEIIDPQTRAAFLGLDPHLTLNHESSDWTYGGFYV